MGRRRRWPWLLGGLLLLPVLVLGLVLVALQTVPVQRGLVALAEEAVPGLTIGALRGAPPFEMRVEEVALADAEGAWLTLDRGRLTWNPWPLFGAIVEIGSLRLGTLSVMRAPLDEAEPVAEAPPETAEPAGLPALPLGLRIEELSVERLSLGAPLLGERLDLGITGRLAAGDARRVETSLRVEQLGGEGRIAASAVLEPEARRLRAEVTADAPAGGLVSRLSGLPGEPPVAVRLSGSGPLAGWEGNWSVAAGAALQAEGRLAVTGLEPPGLRLTGRAALAEALPPELRRLAAPEVGFALSGSYGETTRLEIERIDSAALALFGSARADLEAETLQADLSAEVLDPGAIAAVAPGVGLDAGRVRVRAEGALTRPDLRVTAEASGLRAPPVSADAVTAELQGAAALPADLVLDLEVEGLEGPPALAQAVGTRLTAFAQAQVASDTLQLDRLTLETPALSANGDGTLELADLRGDLALRLAYPGLDRLAPLAGLALDGGLEAQAYATLDGAGGISGLANGSFPHLALGLPEAEALLGPAPGFWAEARLSEAGALSLSGLSLDGVALQLTGQGSLDGEEVAAQLEVRLPDLGALQTAGLPLAGRASLDLQVSKSLAAPEITAQLDAPDLQFAGIPLSDLAVALDTSGLPPALAGRLEASGATPVGALALSGDLAVTETQAEVQDLRLARGGDSLGGRLSIPLSGTPAAGDLRLRVADLGAYAELVPELAGGSLSADVELSARGGGQAAAARVRAEGVRLDDGTRLSAASLEARATDLLGDPSLQARAQLEELRAGGVALAQVSATADGRLDGLGIELAAEGATADAAARPVSLSASGRLALDAAVRLELQGLEGRYGDLEARLRQPARLVYGSDRLQASGLRLAFNEGELDLEAELAGDSVEAELTLRDVPLELAERAGVDVPLGGRLRASARVSGALPRPRGEFSLRTDGLRVPERVTGETLPLSLSVDGRLDGGRLDAEAQLSGLAGENLNATASLPLLIRNDPPAVELPPDEPLSLVSDWSGRLEPIVGILPLDVVRIEGEGDLSLAIEGTLAAPQASGALTVTDGVYENYTLGTLLRPFTLRVTGEGSRLVLQEFDAQDPGGGGLAVSGWVDLAGEVPSFDLVAQTSALDAVRRDDLRITTDTDLSLAGDLEQARLTGGITLQEGEISLAADLPASIPTLDVREINTGRPEPPPQEEEELAPDPGLAFLGLDVELSIPGRLFVRGRGLDSEWQGTFRLTGTAAAPRLQGDLQPVRGFFDLAGKQFQLESGRVSFTGGADFDPQLDLTTVFEEDGFTARINISGPASAPELTLTSSPPLPDDEILSRILFGQSTARLSAAQAVQIAQAAATLTGGGGTGVLDFARQTLGVDVLTFAPGTSDSDLGAVEAGKYLSDDVFVGVRQGARPGSSGAVVEWEIIPSLKLESQVGASSEDNNLGLQWEWDY